MCVRCPGPLATTTAPPAITVAPPATTSGENLQQDSQALWKHIVPAVVALS